VGVCLRSECRESADDEWRWFHRSQFDFDHDSDDYNYTYYTCYNEHNTVVHRSTHRTEQATKRNKARLLELRRALPHQPTKTRSLLFTC